MSLAQRMLQSQLAKEFSDQAEKLNNILETTFKFDIDWSILQESDMTSGWTLDTNLEHLRNNYFVPLERAFTRMFEEHLFREAVVAQVHTIRIEPNTDLFAYFEFRDGVLMFQKSFGGNPPGSSSSELYMDSAETNLKACLEANLR